MRLRGPVVLGALAAIATPIVVGLGLVVHHAPHLGLDDHVAAWVHRHRAAGSTGVARLVTALGSTPVVLVLGIALAAALVARWRRWPDAALLIVAVGGEKLINTIVQHAIDRPRPAYRAAASALGPGFPSGHSATAATFYATVSWVIARDGAPRTRAGLAAAAIVIGVAVAASRVILELHWVTDVVAGLALGWAWFAICALAAGRRRPRAYDGAV